MRGLGLAVAAALALFAAVPSEAADGELSEGQVKAIEGVIQDYLVRHPEVVIDAIRAYQAEQTRKEEQARRQLLTEQRGRLEDPATSYVTGNPDGDVTLIEFFDYRCPYCKRVVGHIAKLREEDKGLRIVFKEFPILGPESVIASRAALASRAQGKYEAFHDALMASRGSLDQETVMQIAAEVGLDVERLARDMKGDEIMAVIEENYRLARALGIDSTPTFIIGNELVRGAVPLDSIKSYIVQARTN